MKGKTIKNEINTWLFTREALVMSSVKRLNTI